MRQGCNGRNDGTVGRHRGRDHVAVIAAERKPRPVIAVCLREVVRRTMEQSGHTGHDDAPHVCGTMLFRIFREIPVHGVSHLRIDNDGIPFHASESKIWLGERPDRRHLPVSRLGILTVTGETGHLGRASDDWTERLPGERHDLVLHERHNLRPRPLPSVRIDGIVDRIRNWR